MGMGIIIPLFQPGCKTPSRDTLDLASRVVTVPTEGPGNGVEMPLGEATLQGGALAKECVTGKGEVKSL